MLSLSNFQNKCPYRALIFILLLQYACTHEPFEMEDMSSDDMNTEPIDNNNSCHPDSIYFVNQILPLLNSSCGISGCHDRTSATDGVILVDYQSIVETGNVKPFDAEDSELYEVLIDDDPDDRMPPSPRSPLTEDQINLIATWINQGALNNGCESADCDLSNASYANDITAIIDAHCKGCHSGGSPSGGIDLSNYDNVKTYADDGRLFGSIAHLDGFSPMPQNQDKLNQCSIDKIKLWIDNGALDN